MEHKFFPTTATRADALRWLSISEKLLYSRDIFGCKSIATRARDADPTLTHADQILAVVDTLIAGDRRVGNNKHDWYSILRISPSRGRDADHVAANFRSLGLLLNPQVNKYPYADEAFRLVIDAWTVLSNPNSKNSYDREIGGYVQTQPDPFVSSQNTFHGMGQNQNFICFAEVGGSSGVNFPGVEVNAGRQRVDPVGSSSQVTPGLKSVGSGGISGFEASINTGSGTVYRQVNDRSSSSFAGNVNVLNEKLGNNDGNINPCANVNLNDGAHMHGTNGKSENNNGNINSNGFVNMNDEASEHENGATTMNMQGNAERVDVMEEINDNDDVESFWTACPYCYYVYEYPQMYIDCTLRCQNCKRAFQGVVIPSPPPILDGQDSYFCCWGFLPLGFSMEDWERNKGNISSSTPFIPMTGTKGVHKNASSWVYIDDDDDDEAIMEASDASRSSDDDWDSGEEKSNKSNKNVRGHTVNGAKPNTRSGKKAKVGKGKQKVVDDESVVEVEVEAETSNKKTAETSKKGASINPRKQPARAAKNCGKLDLNVEFSNEAEDSVSRANQGNQRSNEGEDDNIEGTGFFEGLDEFLSSLPILNVVGDDKAAKGT